ncbi:uncharacterized protein LOC133530504 isoform X1 [Cydia pomonella]|uniref:uncharacterized protein LOC133530504 isoform X1 n=1 Tax=Cydia pomonella TaxID=82600 RepID=UPI002ADE3265|nr:uncharacterized protein LOC133530504 isoform X1 [Cydia pomonella]
MRAWLLVCAALAFAPGPTSATAAHPSRVRDDHIKGQILAKLGLTSRPTPLRAPPRDVVRKILQRAADPAPAHTDYTEPQDMREIIAIAHREIQLLEEPCDHSI